MMDLWEYRIIEIQDSEGEAGFRADNPLPSGAMTISTWGQSGWELIAVVPGGGHSYRCFFKRLYTLHLMAT